MILAVIDSAGGKHGVGEGERPDVQHAEVQELHHLAETKSGKLRKNKVFVARRVGAVDVDDVSCLVDLHVELDPGVGGHG